MGGVHSSGSGSGRRVDRQVRMFAVSQITFACTYLPSPCFFAVNLWPLIKDVPSSCYTQTPPPLSPFWHLRFMFCGGVPSPCGHRLSPGSVPLSAGTKGLECSPSTPTMNSYFYKFMINLLRRFSSERRLLEVRGAFIIRSAVVFHFHTARGFRATVFSFASLAAFPDLCVLERKKESSPLHTQLLVLPT